MGYIFEFTQWQKVHPYHLLEMTVFVDETQTSRQALGNRTWLPRSPYKCKLGVWGGGGGGVGGC